MKRLIKSIVASIAIACGVQLNASTEDGQINFLDFDNLLNYEKQTLEYDALYADSQDSTDGVSYRYWVDENDVLPGANTIIGSVKSYEAIPEEATSAEAYLELDTDSAIYRRMSVAEGEAVAYDMGSVYIDTLAQFTAADEDTESAVCSDKDKIVVWMKEKNMETEHPSTNLMITCGTGTYEVDTINSNPWEAEKWYRLVIKSGKTLTADSKPGFLVYISENTTDATTLTKVSATRTIVTVTGEGEEQVTETQTETIDVFPSMIEMGEMVDKLSHVGFSGMGKIDEVNITSNDPCPDVKYFNLTWDANIASLSYTVGDGAAVELSAEDLALGAKTIELPAEGGTITLTYAAIDGFTAVGAGQNCSVTIEDSTVEGTVEGDVEGGVITVAQDKNKPSFAITTKANNFFVGETPYETFAEALANIGEDKTIKLGANVVLNAKAAEGAVYLVEGDVILDLAGKTIQACVSVEDADNFEVTATIINYGANLTIINSTPEVGSILGMRIGDGEEAFNSDAISQIAGSLTINAGNIEGNVAYSKYSEEEGISNEVEILGGKFASDSADAFYLVDCLAEGYSASYADGYWTVALGGGEEPDPEPETVTYTITYSSTTGVVPEAKTVTVLAGTPYALTEEDLAPLADANGYRFSKWWMPGGENNVIAKVGDQITADVTLTASWVIREYTISYATEIGDVPTATTLMPYDANAATAIPANRLPELSAEGYVFGGWKLGDALVEADVTTITGDVTLTAVWSIKPYTITYVNKRGASNPPSKTVTPATANGEYTLTDAELESFTMTGYIFGGYKNESGNIVKAGDVITGDVTLTLAWNIKITYETAQGVAPEAIYKDVTDTGVYSITADDMPTLDNVKGYTFSHWTYTSGGVVSVGSNITRNTTLVAVWNAVAPVDPWAPEAEGDAAAAEAAKDIFGEDSAVATKITTAAQYNELVSYIKTVKGDTVEPTDLTTDEKTYILDSLALGAAELFIAEPEVEFTDVVADTAPEAEPGDWTFNVKVTGLAKGDTVERAIKVAEDNVKALVKICTDLTQGNWAKPADANIEAAEGSNNEISVKIKFGDAKRGFIKIKK